MATRTKPHARAHARVLALGHLPCCCVQSELAARKLVVSNLDDALCNASFVAPEQYMIGFVNDGPGVTGALPQVTARRHCARRSTSTHVSLVRAPFDATAVALSAVC